MFDDILGYTTTLHKNAKIQGVPSVVSVEDAKRTEERLTNENELQTIVYTTPTTVAPAPYTSNAATNVLVTRQEIEELRATMNQILAIVKESKKDRFLFSFCVHNSISLLFVFYQCFSWTTMIFLRLFV